MRRPNPAVDLIGFALLLIAMLLAAASIQPARAYDDDDDDPIEWCERNPERCEEESSGPPELRSPSGRFLGTLSDNPFDRNSTSNPFGRYGSKFSRDSINNPLGRWGNPIGSDSARNPLATGRRKKWN